MNRRLSGPETKRPSEVVEHLAGPDHNALDFQEKCTMATRTVVGSTPTPSHPCEGLANTPAAPTVGTHPKEAHELALQASYRIEGLANVLQRELMLQECGCGVEHIVREIQKLNSVVMSVLAEDAIAQLANFADIVSVEVSHG